MGKPEDRYTTLESLLTSKGRLNSAIMRRDWFTNTPIYRNVLSDTKYLDVFDGMTFADRFSILHENTPVGHCRICGEPYVYVKSSQHSYRKCNHKFNMDTERLSSSQMESSRFKKIKFIESINDKSLRLDESIFTNLLNGFNRKPDNFGFIVTDRNFDFFHDLVVKTENILSFDPTDFRFSERIYISINNLKQIPRCEYCDTQTKFNNRKIGYSRTCPKHSHILASRQIVMANRDKIDNVFNFGKYEILKYPELLTNDNLVIRCKNCGSISEWDIADGKTAFLGNRPLCRNCENSISKKEESLFNMISSIYKDEIVHHNGSRKIIPPYELDIYLPERKLAFEFDGIFWHSESNGGKDPKYHLMKTEMCERNGIQLIHVFESEFERKHEIVKSRIKNLLGVYDNVVYARKCVVRNVDFIDADPFLNENHLQGSVKSSVNLGLFHGDEMVSLMTFRKPRMTGKHEWELLRFCSKLGYHVVGGAGKLLKHFEIEHKPKSLISYADRRWSVGRLYSALGFEFSHSSNPNYWYFKPNNPFSLKNRMQFQKFRLSGVLEKFDENLTEVQNMRNDGYDRIFDCGNLVFVKTYG